MNVLITGANRGIGLGFVEYYLNQGCQVWGCYRNDLGGLSDITSPDLHTVQWDVQDDKAADELAQMGLPDSLDLLINNAGVYGANQSFESVTTETMKTVFDIDCLGALRVAQALKSRIEKASGVIANLSSKMGSSDDNSSGGCYAYRAAKAALVIVSKSMAIDLAEYGIQVITLHPGWVRTDMTGHGGLIDVTQSVSGMASVIQRISEYEPGAFVAFDGKIVPY